MKEEQNQRSDLSSDLILSDIVCCGLSFESSIVRLLIQCYCESGNFAGTSLRAKYCLGCFKFWFYRFVGFANLHYTHNMILTTFSLACTSLSFRRANTWMCELTCFRVLVLPVRNLMYRAISSLRPKRTCRRGRQGLKRHSV